MIPIEDFGELEKGLEADKLPTHAVANESENTSLTEEDGLRFRVSTGLKRVLGRELITDDEVAIFELVKNSFDAGARNVYLVFEPDEVSVIDDGSGMSLQDLKDKWLFVAYSAKRGPSDRRADYRDHAADNKRYAGSKGIGRFSSDRLGQVLTLQTRSQEGSNELVQQLVIDWDRFEANDQERFELIDVGYTTKPGFDLPSGVPQLTSGTVIRISNLARDWDREAMLRLRAGLAKLINPFGSEADDFSITLIAAGEIDEDKVARSKAKTLEGDESLARVVNGRIHNFIFSTLREKTTFIDVTIEADSNRIRSRLIDRGELIYEILEPNAYSLLAGADFRCELYFLNRAAKATFARRMGVASVRFGSVFLFRNGFRVVPIGEEGDDWFGIDGRKQQGFSRYLGTRDIIGRIDVSGSDAQFQEASSRNQGLISTPAVRQLKECFWEQCLKRLERYVVPVTWKTQTDLDSETLAVLDSDSGRAKISAAVAGLIGSEDVELISYSRRMIDVLNERSDLFEASLASLRVIADRTQDAHLAERIVEAEDRFRELKAAEAEARRIADEERRAKLEAEARAEEAEAKADATTAQLHEERKRNLFLASMASLDTETVIHMHHSITMYATRLQGHITNLLTKINKDKEMAREDLISRLEQISMLNSKVVAASKFATKANFRLESDLIEADLPEFIEAYIDDVAREYLSNEIDIRVERDGEEFVRKFKPIEVSILVDNLVNNSWKAKATWIEFRISRPKKDLLEIEVSDNGKGVSKEALEEGRLFEKGFTTTSGAGLGLYHVRQIVSDMKGGIDVKNRLDEGTEFRIRIAK